MASRVPPDGSRAKPEKPPKWVDLAKMLSPPRKTSLPNFVFSGWSRSNVKRNDRDAHCNRALKRNSGLGEHRWCRRTDEGDAKKSEAKQGQACGRRSSAASQRHLVQRPAFGAGGRGVRTLQSSHGKVLVEQLGELVGHRAGKFFRIGDGDGAPVIAGHVMADADGQQLDGRARFDLVDHLAQVTSPDRNRS